MHKLNNNWTLWLHLPHDIDWTINSYKKVYSFDTLEDCIKLIENINKEIVEKCMLFIMKNNIKPIWEDPNNSKGGCLSYKIAVDDVYNVWKKLNYSLIGQVLSGDEDVINSINGISISPKKNFCIIKIWISNIKNLINNEIYKFLDSSLNSISENSVETDDMVNNVKHNDPFNIHLLCDIERHNSIFKAHDILY